MTGLVLMLAMVGNISQWNVREKHDDKYSVCKWVVVHRTMGEYGRYNSRELANNVVREIDKRGGKWPSDSDAIFSAASTACKPIPIEEQRKWWREHGYR